MRRWVETCVLRVLYSPRNCLEIPYTSNFNDNLIFVQMGKWIFREMNTNHLSKLVRNWKSRQSCTSHMGRCQRTLVTTCSQWLRSRELRAEGMYWLTSWGGSEVEPSTGMVGSGTVTRPSHPFPGSSFSACLSHGLGPSYLGPCSCLSNNQNNILLR